MQERDDPRIPCYFEPGADGVYRGLGNREAAKTDDEENLLSSVVSNYLFRRDAPELIYSCQEQLLLEAEAYARGQRYPVRVCAAKAALPAEARR